jgi:hypothetical protein
MARRPTFERILKPDDLKTLQDNLSKMNDAGVRELYTYTHRQCGLIGSRVPDAVSIQQLVQAWKQLRVEEVSASSTTVLLGYPIGDVSFKRRS